MGRIHHGVMAGLVPAIHVFLRWTNLKTWMPGTRPGMTVGGTIASRLPRHSNANSR